MSIMQEVTKLMLFGWQLYCGLYQRQKLKWFERFLPTVKYLICSYIFQTFQLKPNEAKGSICIVSQITIKNSKLTVEVDISTL